MSGTWFRERLYGHWQQTFRVERELVRQTGEHQEMVLFETPDFGRVLALDGVIQLTSGDEFIYHEMMAHVPILAHGAMRRVCVVGGGDGGLLREVLKHPGIERVVLVEIDAEVIAFCRRHLPMVSDGAFDDPRVEVVIADGVAFMAGATERFDLIAIDSTDPIGPGEALFSEAFYRDCAAHLTAEGIVVNQNGVPFVQPDEIAATWRRRRNHFADIGFYLAAVPTYIGGAMALGWSSPSPRPRLEPLETLRARLAAIPLSCRYYTPEVHQAAFALPGYVRALIPG